MLQGPIAYLACVVHAQVNKYCTCMDRYGLMDRVRATGSVILRIWKLEPSGGGVDRVHRTCTCKALPLFKDTGREGPVANGARTGRPDV